jgi:hypothetical protein
MSSGLGWVKMRGKKCKVLNCGCCVAENRREDILWNEAANEISYEVSGQAEIDEWHDILARDPSSRSESYVDEFTIAKYTWGQGMSDPRIRAIMAQKQADFLKRVADRWDALEANAA